MATLIEDLLLSHGVKPTPQRAVIAEFLIGTTAHPTADEVFQAVQDKLPVPLSRATVYNTLNCLVGAKVIKEVFTEPGRARYDANVTEHHHFVDVKTGQVLDIEPEQIAQLNLNLGDKFKIHGFHVTIFGEIKGS
jgi:Fe2+ or Zn2+ uptake regulation protein